MDNTYLKAAKILVNRKDLRLKETHAQRMQIYSCFAVDTAAGAMNSEARSIYANLFNLYGSQIFLSYHERLIALLLMHQIANDKDALL